MPGYRLPRGGARIDRTRPLRFSFDGTAVPGFAGDTLASALLAAGHTTVARSFKYHRPRGVYSAGPEEPSALVTIGRGSATEPNAKATIVEAANGLVVRSQNAWPSLKHDFSAVNGLFAPFIAAGFYYKTFMGPTRGAWMFYEPSIRRAAGLGRASYEPDPDRYESTHAFCDVLVVGSGPAGLSAALAAGKAGARVILCEEGPILGGTLDLEDTIGAEAAGDWLFRTTSALADLNNVRQLPRVCVYGYYDDNVLGALEDVAPSGATARKRHWRIEAKHVVLATGALERPFVFPGNDRPGVMLAGAALAYARRHGVAVGNDLVVFTNNDGGWRRAAALARAGVPVRAVIDPRREAPSAQMAELAETGTEALPGHVVTATAGGTALSSIRVEVFDVATGKISGAARDLKCDALAVAAGWNPLIHLASQAGGPPKYDEALHAFLPGAAREKWIAAGADAQHFRCGECGRRRCACRCGGGARLRLRGRSTRGCA